MRDHKSGIKKLPDEVLYEDILPELDRPSLASLCLVSRPFYQKTISKLYSSLCFDVGDCRELNGRTHSIALALHTIVRNPALAGLVDHISITTDWSRFDKLPLPEDIDDAWLTVWNANFRGHEKLYQDSLPALKDLFATRLVSPSIEERCTDLLAVGRVEAVIACLILACNNLQSLTLGSIVWVTSVLDPLLARIFSQSTQRAVGSAILCPDILSKTDVWLHQCTYDCLYPLLGLPAISHVSAPLPDLDLNPGILASSNLIELSLKRTQLSEEALGIVLQSTPRLKRLTYWSCYEWSSLGRRNRTQGESLDCDKLGSSLMHVRHTLEELSLSFIFFDMEIDMNGFGIRGSHGFLSVLPSFPRLASVMIPYVVVLGWSSEGSAVSRLSDALPCSMRTLTLTDDLCDMAESDWSNSDLLEQMRFLVGKLAAGSDLDPRDVLKLHVRNPKSDWDLDETPLSSLCEQAGDFCYVAEPNAHPHQALVLPILTEVRAQDINSDHRADERQRRDFATGLVE